MKNVVSIVYQFIYKLLWIKPILKEYLCNSKLARDKSQFINIADFFIYKITEYFTKDILDHVM